MIPVDQTIFEKGKGNCFSACLASILEMRIDEVVQFPEGNAYNWRELVNEWLMPLELHYIDMQLNGDARDELASYWGYHFIIGTSPRGVRHAVVGYCGQMIHDPHPSRAGLIGDLSYGFLVHTMERTCK